MIIDHKVMFTKNIFTDLWYNFWWKHVDGVEVKVRWPVGEIVVGYDDPRWFDCGASLVRIESADPWDHYGAWLTNNVGRYGWDWSWDLKDDDIAENRLTIRVRKKHKKHVTAIALRWA